MASKCDADKQQKADENRRNFPLTAALLDEFRAVFGSGVKLIWARENGREIGKRSVK